PVVRRLRDVQAAEAASQRRRSATRLLRGPAPESRARGPRLSGAHRAAGGRHALLTPAPQPRLAQGGDVQATARRGLSSATGWRRSSAATIEISTPTTAGSSWEPALLPSSARASECDSASLYARSVRIAFQVSQHAMILASRGITVPARPSG